MYQIMPLGSQASYIQTAKRQSPYLWGMPDRAGEANIYQQWRKHCPLLFSGYSASLGTVFGGEKGGK